MTTIARLDMPATDPRLGRFVTPMRSWWQLEEDDPGRFGVAVAELVLRLSGASQGGWVMEVTGSPSAVRYVSASLPSAASGTPSRVILGPLDGDQVVDALDRAETARARALLLQVIGTDLDAVAGWLGQTGRLTGDVGPAAILTVDAEQCQAIVGVLGDAGALVPGAHALPMVPALPPAHAEPAAPASVSVRRRGRRGQVGLAATLAVITVVAGLGSWLRLRSSAPHRAAPVAQSPAPIMALPQPRYQPSVASDPATGNVLLFGGGQVVGRTTWIWAKQGWRSASEGAAPSDRFGSAMAYDPLLKAVLLFGGREIAGAVPNDTWAWDGRTWSQLAPPSTPGPPGYEFSAMAWDEAHQQMVLVTTAPVSTVPQNNAVTWTWAGNGWARRDTVLSPPAPGPVVFDPATRSVLLVTGSTPTSTWSWDGFSWHYLEPAHLPATIGPAFMAAVPGTSQVILTSYSASAAEPPHTWTWDGRDWTTRPSPPAPGGISGMVADAASGAVIAFGGAPGSGPLHEAWAWTGATWARLTLAGPGAVEVTSVHPPPRQGAVTAYDQGRHQLVLYGGSPETQGTTAPPELTDTWLFDGQRWTRAPTSSHPPASAPMAFDPVTGNVITVADANGSNGYTVVGLARPLTWSWNGTSWRQLHPAAELPNGTVPMALVTDPATATVVALATCCQPGGSGAFPSPPADLSTWIWDGHRWSDAHPKLDIGLGVARLAYDAGSHRVLAIVSDGSANAGVTWSWDGSTWSRLHPPQDVAFDLATAVVTGDPATSTVVMIERSFQDGSTDAGGTVMWDGAGWTDHTTAVLPAVDTAFGNAALYYDPQLGHVVVLNGILHDYSQRWMWTGSAWLELTMA